MSVISLKTSILAREFKTIAMTNDNHKNPYCAVGLCNPKSPANVGSVIRACGCFSADHIFYTGIRYDRAERFYTDTTKNRNQIPLQQVDDLARASGDDTQIVCVELCENAVALAEFTHPDRACYLFGPEDGSLSQQLINAADHVVFIPSTGCLNMAATVNVVLYDRAMKHTPALNTGQRNELVRNNRDCRNNLKAGVGT